MSTGDPQLRPRSRPSLDTVLAVVAMLGIVATGAGIVRTLRPPVAHAAALETVGGIVGLVGHPERREVDSLVWDYIGMGSAVWRGDALYVGEGGLLALRLTDGGQLVVNERSLVVIDPPQPGGQATIQLKSGSLSGEVGQAGLTIKLPQAAAKLQPTSIAQINVRPEGGQVVVTRGEAQVLPTQGSALTVKGAESATVSREGQAVSTPLQVHLEAPAVSASLYFAGPSMAVTFRWQTEVPEVVFELFLHGDLAHPVVRARLQGAELKVPALLEGSYQWRVQPSRDAYRQSELRALTLIREEAPLPMRPTRGQILYLPEGQTSTLLWSAQAGVTEYQVQIAATPEFAAPLLDVTVTEPRLVVKAFGPEGIYLWRVRGAVVGRAPPFSEPIPFRLIVEPLPEAPKLFDPEIEVPKSKPPDRGEQGLLDWGWRLLWGVAHAAAASNAVVTLRWSPVPGINRFELQIAEDAAFTKLVVTDKVTAVFYRFTPPQARPYYWRVRSIDVKERTGLWSASKTVELGVHAPTLQEPADDARVDIGASVPELTFVVSQPKNTARCEVQLYEEGKPLATLATESGRATFKPAGVARLSWQARCADSAGQWSLWSTSRALEVRLGVPRALPYEGHTPVLFTSPPPQLTLICRRLASAVGYNLSITGDALKKALELQTEAPKAQVIPEQPGMLQWRCRAIDAKGTRTAWSDPQSLAIDAPPPAVPEAVTVVVPPPVSRDAKPPVTPTPPVVEPTPAQKPTIPVRRSPLRVGGALGVFTDFASTGSLHAAFEVGYDLWQPRPSWQLSVVGRLGYYQATIGSAVGPDATQHTVPLTLGAQGHWPFSSVTPVVEVGLVTALMHARLTRSGAAALTRTRVGLGAELGGGVLRDFAGGDLVLMLRVQWLHSSDALFDYDGTGLSPTVEYRLRL